MSERLKQDKLKNFTVIRNEIIEDKTLSFKALGLAVFMLHLPPNWEFSVSGLSAVTKKGESSIKSALKELEEKGYLKREQTMNGGKFGHMTYIITDKLKEQDFTSAENTPAWNTPARNHGQINTKETSTNLPTTKETISINTLSAEFENLWSMYPKKQGKNKAYGYYEKARKSGTTYEEVEQGIRAYNEYIEANGIDIQYVKMGRTFFSQNAWQDDWGIRNGRKDKEQVGRVHDRPTERDSGRVAGTANGSREGNGRGRTTFPKVGFGFQEEE